MARGKTPRMGGGPFINRAKNERSASPKKGGRRRLRTGKKEVKWAVKGGGGTVISARGRIFDLKLGPDHTEKEHGNRGGPDKKKTGGGGTM